MNAQSPTLGLDDFKKLWIKAKVAQFYRQDPYLKNLDCDIALSHFNELLYKSKNLSQLLSNLKTSGHYQKFKITRKTDGKSYFEYPALDVHVESLFELWPKICSHYEKNEFLSLTNRFGHRPNLSSNFSTFDDSSEIKERDIRINCNLKIPFQDDYPSFKKATIETANETLKKSAFKNAHVLVIQSDIEKFFHKLKLAPVAKFLIAHHGEIAPHLNLFISKIEQDFGFESLPIGWSLSGIVADMISIKYHELLRSRFNTELKERIKNLDLKKDLRKILPDAEAEEAISKEIAGFISTASLEYKSAINYVDDFIFVLEFNVSEQFKDKKLIKTYEKLVTSIVIELAEKLLNKLFENALELKLYRPDDEKGRHFSFDKANIDTLNSNFFNIANNTPSDPEESNIWSRLDEFLLPADNDLTLNERTQFFMHLANLRHKILDGETLEEEELESIFQKIILKIQGSEAKYIYSVLRLIEALVVSGYDRNINFCTKVLSSIYEEFEKANKPLDLWLKFFKGYFKIYSKLSFDPIFKFYDDFDKFIEYWSQNISNEDDRDLLQAIKVSFLLSSVPRKTSLNVNFLEVMNRRRKGVKSSISMSKLFLGFNVSSKSKKVRIHINHLFDSFAIAAFIKNIAKYRNINVDSYLDLGRKIKKKLSIESAIQFYNLSMVNVLPRWSEEEIQLFLGQLPSITSQAHYQTVRRSLRLAAGQYKAIGSSYLSRLSHLHQSLVLQGDPKIKNIPRIYGGGLVSSYRSMIFYLATLEANSLQDLQKAYLSSLVPIDSFRDFSYLHVPVALRKTGVAFLNVLKAMISMPANQFDHKIIKKIVESISQKETLAHLTKGSQLKKYKNEAVCHIEVNEIDPRFFQKKEGPLYLTLCPIGMSESDFCKSSGLTFEDGVHEKLDLKIESAINEAKKRGSDVVVFPELTLPRRYILKYLDMCAKKGLVLIAGLEYVSDRSGEARNSTIISFPIDKTSNPYGRSFLAFEQDKHYPAAREKDDLEGTSTYRYLPGSCLYIFNSKRFSNFSVLTCSDFLSLRLRLKLQEKVQTVFVPAQNLDMTTYVHIAESSIRDLHCFAVICNNQDIGGSFIYAPYRDQHKRTIFRKDGSTLPEFLTMKWEPNKVIASQKADSQKSFEKDNLLKPMKQTPPDWGYE